jgi:uncharacterized protein (UPF0548 family)
MRAEAQWIRERRTMRIGDIIVQRAVLPPIGFGICAEFAVRISALISEPSKLGFAYETLAGHLERGVSEFYFEERAGEIIVCRPHALGARTLAFTARKGSFQFAISALVHAASAEACKTALPPRQRAFDSHRKEVSCRASN